MVKGLRSDGVFNINRITCVHSMFTIWNRVCLFFFGGALFDVIMKHVFGHSYWDLLSMIKTLAARLPGTVTTEVLKHRNRSP